MKLRLSNATIAKLELRPGDYVVIRTKRQLTRELAEHLKDQLRAIIGDHEILVLPPDLALSVVANPSARPASE